jgi:hypothetical protein
MHITQRGFEDPWLDIESPPFTIPDWRQWLILAAMDKLTNSFANAPQQDDLAAIPHSSFESKQRPIEISKERNRAPNRR